MNVDRTIKLKLDLSEYDKETLRLTMSISNHVFNEIAQYGFDHQTCSKVSIHHATYYDIREKYPELPCSILQGIRDVACESLKGVELKKLPKSKQYSAIRYNKRVCNINLSKQAVTLASIKGRVKATFPIPEYYRKYLDWELRTSTLSYNKQQDTFYLHVTIDPRYTSQKCSNCGHIYKGNRKGNSFHCVKCGFQIHADLNAAQNIADIGKSGVGRLTVNQPYMTCNEVEAHKGIDTEHSYNAPPLRAE